MRANRSSEPREIPGSRWDGLVEQHGPLDACWVVIDDLIPRYAEALADLYAARQELQRERALRALRKLLAQGLIGRPVADTLEADIYGSKLFPE